MSPNSSSTISSSTHGTSLHHRLTLDESDDTYFQIQSSERPDLCIEVFKSLDQVGRLWVRQCKSKSDSGIERQMFGVTSDGKLHPSSSRSSSCIFLYNNKKLKYRKDCAGILNNKKNQFMYNFFDGTFFLMGDITKVMTTGAWQGKKEIKLQKGSASKITKQRWTIHFERDRVLQGNCNSNTVVPPRPSSTYYGLGCEPDCKLAAGVPSTSPIVTIATKTSLTKFKEVSKAFAQYLVSDDFVLEKYG